MKNIYETYKDIIVGGFSLETWDDIINRWNEPHRYYHNINHLNHILNQFRILYENNSISKNEYDKLVITSFFHDVIYNPKVTDNEQQSVNYFLDKCFEKNIASDDFKKEITQIILDTGSRNTPTNNLSYIFWEIDNSILSSSISELIDVERKIFKEFQWVSYEKYKEARINFINSCIGIFDGDYDDNLKELIKYVENRKIHIGVYAGSFDPFHIGHMNILKKSMPMFDKVVVAFGNNPDKEKSEKVFPEILDYVHRLSYDGLITDLLDDLETNGVTVTLIRGIRNGIDLSYETNQVSFIQDIRPNTNIVYIPADKQYEHISSSAIRSLMKYDKQKTKKYINCTW